MCVLLKHNCKIINYGLCKITACGKNAQRHHGCRYVFSLYHCAFFQDQDFWAGTPYEH